MKSTARLGGRMMIRVWPLLIILKLYFWQFNWLAIVVNKINIFFHNFEHQRIHRFRTRRIDKFFFFFFRVIGIYYIQLCVETQTMFVSSSRRVRPKVRDLALGWQMYNNIYNMICNIYNLILFRYTNCHRCVSLILLAGHPHSILL